MRQVFWAAGCSASGLYLTLPTLLLLFLGRQWDMRAGLVATGAAAAAPATAGACSPGSAAAAASRGCLGLCRCGGAAAACT